MSGMSGDPNADMNSLMNIYKMQYTMNQLQAFNQSLPELSQRLGVPVQTLAAVGPDMVRQMLEKEWEAKQPPTQARDYQWFENDYATKHAGDLGPDGKPIGEEGARRQFEQENPPGNFMGGYNPILRDPSMRAMTAASMAWDRNPANQNKTKPDYLVDNDKWKIHQANVSEATTTFSGVNSKLDTYIGTLGDVANDENLGSIVGSNIPFAEQIGKGLISRIPGTATYDLGVKIGGLGEASKAASQGGPHQVDLSSIGVNAGDFTKTGLSKDQYLNDVIAPHMRAALTAKANMYGASGQVNVMPGYLKPYLDPIYQEGGQLDMGTGFKPFTPDKNKKPIPDDMNARIKRSIESIGAELTLNKLRQAGYDTSSLE
jgi:hypothetical protein